METFRGKSASYYLFLYPRKCSGKESSYWIEQDSLKEGQWVHQPIRGKKTLNLQSTWISVFPCPLQNFVRMYWNYTSSSNFNTISLFFTKYGWKKTNREQSLASWPLLLCLLLTTWIWTEGEVPPWPQQLPLPLSQHKVSCKFSLPGRLAHKPTSYVLSCTTLKQFIRKRLSNLRYIVETES